MRAEGLVVEEPGWAFVAYLDGSCGLVDCYPIQLMPGQSGLLVVAGDVASRRRRWERVLWGRPAELLFMAVSGRFAGGGPGEASVCVAERARRILADGLDEPGFAEAYAAACWFGDFIEPWFGVTALSEEGRLLLEEGEYFDRVDLPLDVSEIISGLEAAYGGGGGGSDDSG